MTPEDDEFNRIEREAAMRKDLNMSKGKMVVQGAHASIAFLTHLIRGYNGESLLLSKAEKEWVYGTFFKVCVGVDSEKELLDIGYNAVAKGLSVKYIEETGGFDKPTLTCLAIGPDYSSVIDPITKHLKLL